MLGYRRNAWRRRGALLVAGAARSAPVSRCGAYNARLCVRARTRGTWRGSHYGPEKDFDLKLLQIAFLKLRDLVKPLLTNCTFGLLEGQVLTLDDGAAHRALALFIALDASAERHIEQYQGGRHLVLFSQVEQVLPSLRGEGCGVNHAETIDRKPLFYKEMY